MRDTLIKIFLATLFISCSSGQEESGKTPSLRMIYSNLGDYSLAVYGEDDDVFSGEYVHSYQHATDSGVIIMHFENGFLEGGYYQINQNNDTIAFTNYLKNEPMESWHFERESKVGWYRVTSTEKDRQIADSMVKLINERRFSKVNQALTKNGLNFEKTIQTMESRYGKLDSIVSEIPYTQVFYHKNDRVLVQPVRVKFENFEFPQLINIRLDADEIKEMTFQGAKTSREIIEIMDFLKNTQNEKERSKIKTLIGASPELQFTMVASFGLHIFQHYKINKNEVLVLHFGFNAAENVELLNYSIIPSAKALEPAVIY